ncbi:MAG: hypothetical protein KF852_09695 [Saprospiraceae bacterium]|nr:hypothetical protein [Saprospiraceae bacterium]
MLNLSELLEAYPLALRIHRSFIQLDMEEMVKDVRNFLFYPADEKKIRLFLPLLEQSDF